MMANAGLKAFCVDHVKPSMEDGHQVFIVSDEHITLLLSEPVAVGDLV